MSPGGDTVETLYAERNDRQIHLRGKETPRLVLDNAFTVAAARPEPMLKYHLVDGSRRRADRSCGRPPGRGRTHASRRGDGQGTWHRRPAEDRTPQLVLSRAKAKNGDISISLTKGRLN